MQLNNQIYWSLYYYLSEYFYYSKNKAPLTTEDNKIYKSENNLWLTSRDVKVYINGIETPMLYEEATFLSKEQILENEDLQQRYKVNYKNGYIEFVYPLLQTDVVTADYSYTWLGIHNAWRTEEFSPPAMFVYAGVDEEKPLQLGGGEIYNMLFGVDIFGVNESQRNDIAYMLRSALKYKIKIYDYSTAFPLDVRGYINPSFNIETQFRGYMDVPDIRKIKIEYNPLKSGEEMEKFRANVRFHLETLSQEV